MTISTLFVNGLIFCFSLIGIIYFVAMAFINVYIIILIILENNWVANRWRTNLTIKVGILLKTAINYSRYWNSSRFRRGSYTHRTLPKSYKLNWWMFNESICVDSHKSCILYNFFMVYFHFLVCLPRYLFAECGGNFYGYTLSEYSCVYFYENLFKCYNQKFTWLQKWKINGVCW